MLRFLLVGWLMLSMHYSVAQPNAPLPVTEVRIPNFQPGTGDFYFYIKTLLSLALAQTDAQYGPVILLPNNQLTSQQEQFDNLSSGTTDITWSVTSIERENRNLVVRTPLTGGLFGYRVLLIRRNHKQFEAPLSLATLRSLTAIQGQGWPDVDILTFNQFKVITDTYPATFNRLSEGSADYFPRAAHEVFEELTMYSPDSFSIYPYIAMQYDNPMFFFVTKGKPELAQRLEIGLQKLVQNGDLNRLLTSQHFYIRARNQLTGMTLLQLDNPLLSDHTKDAIRHYESPLQNVF